MHGDNEVTEASRNPTTANGNQIFTAQKLVKNPNRQACDDRLDVMPRIVHKRKTVHPPSLLGTKLHHCDYICIASDSENDDTSRHAKRPKTTSINGGRSELPSTEPPQLCSVASIPSLHKTVKLSEYPSPMYAQVPGNPAPKIATRPSPETMTSCSAYELRHTQ
jgi:hypothetical protein